MADLLASQVALFPGNTSLSESEFFGARARTLVFRRIKITGGTVGGTTNKITAAALGMNKLVGCTSLFDAQNTKVYPAVIDPVNNIVLLMVGAANAPADVTTNAGYMTIWGY